MSCRLYLAGEGLSWAKTGPNGKLDQNIARRVNRLKSFFYVNKNESESPGDYKSFMLDSGAYTFAYGSKAKVNLSDYFDRYKSYVKENNVKLFYELDIDELIGYESVLQYRKALESYVGRQCMPVWHVGRGKSEWLRMCDEYDYVAIGGIADRGRKSIEEYIPWFTREAHRRGTKVHGLGYTSLKNLPRMGFDSVDSAAWLYGNIAAFVYVWNGYTMQKVEKPSGKKMNSRKVAEHNFLQWVKMAESMEE